MCCNGQAEAGTGPPYLLPDALLHVWVLRQLIESIAQGQGGGLIACRKRGGACAGGLRWVGGNGGWV